MQAKGKLVIAAIPSTHGKMRKIYNQIGQTNENSAIVKIFLSVDTYPPSYLVTFGTRIDDCEEII